MARHIGPVVGTLAVHALLFGALASLDRPDDPPPSQIELVDPPAIETAAPPAPEPRTPATAIAKEATPGVATTVSARVASPAPATPRPASSRPPAPSTSAVSGGSRGSIETDPYGGIEVRSDSIDGHGAGRGEGRGIGDGIGDGLGGGLGASAGEGMLPVVPGPPAPPASQARSPFLIDPPREPPMEDEYRYLALISVDEDGGVVGVQLLKGHGGRKDDLATQMAWHFRYRPALDEHGHRVAVRIRQPFQFCQTMPGYSCIW